MKKVLFLMFLLLLMGLGAASVKAQVRIGGNAAPNAAAVLDLNATDATNAGTKTLALPRVSLASTTDLLSNTTLLTGMLVYNTNTALGVGVYYWDGSKWVKVSDGSFVEGDGVIGNEVLNATTGGGLTRSGSGTAASPYTLGIATGGVTKAMLAAGTAFDGDSIVGNEVTNATSGGGLIRAGSGTTASPYTLGINSGGVTTTMIANGAVTLPKIAAVPADSGKFLINTGSSVAWSPLYGTFVNNPDSIKTARPARPVTWTVVVDTTFLLTVPASGSARVYVYGLRDKDLCTMNSQGYGVILGARTNEIWLSAFSTAIHAAAVPLTCYRPTF